MLYVCTRLSKTEWIISNVALEVVLPDNIDLDLIPYYFSIKGFLKSRPKQFESMIIRDFVGHGYLVIQLVSTIGSQWLSHISLHITLFQTRL